MIVAVAVLVGVATVPLAGGDLARLGELRLRFVPCALLAFALQVVLFEVVDERVSTGTGALLHVVSFLLAVAFVAANRRLPGLALVAVGAALNLCAIVANGGVMPSSTGPPSRHGAVNAAAVEDARLAVLGDALSLPLPGPLGAAFSVGDVLIITGGVVLVHVVCRRGDPRCTGTGAGYSTATTST